MARNDLFIYGAGGLGREILSLIKTLGHWIPIGFIDDRLAKGTEVAGLKVLGGKEVLTSLTEKQNVILAIGDPQLKGKIFERWSNHEINFPTLIHPSAILQDVNSITIGEGSIITAGCILTTNIKIGTHGLINLNTTIGHDVQIGDFASIMPGVNVAGEVTIGEAVLVGSGANIINRVVIGNYSRIGMGSVVIHNVSDNETVAGVPARPLHG